MKDRDDQQTRQVLLNVLQTRVRKFGSGIRRVLGHEEIVALGGDPEAFLAIEAAEGWAFLGGYVEREGGEAEPHAAEHGYLPERPAMRTSLLVYGPAIGHGKIPRARLIDVAPTVARWLGLNLDKAEGRPLEIPVR